MIDGDQLAGVLHNLGKLITCLVKLNGVDFRTNFYARKCKPNKAQ